MGSSVSRKKEEFTLDDLLKLNLLEFQVMRLRLGIVDERQYTLSEVSWLFGISRERVRQIQKLVIRKIQNKFVRRGLGLWSKRGIINYDSDGLGFLDHQKAFYESVGRKER